MEFVVCSPIPWHTEGPFSEHNHNKQFKVLLALLPEFSNFFKSLVSTTVLILLLKIYVADTFREGELFRKISSAC